MALNILNYMSFDIQGTVSDDPYLTLSSDSKALFVWLLCVMCVIYMVIMCVISVNVSQCDLYFGVNSSLIVS